MSPRQRPPDNLSDHPSLMRPAGSTAIDWSAVPVASPTPLAVLTGTEIEVAMAVADGLPNREIAARLYVSTKTIEYHLTRIYRKLKARSRTDLVRLVLTANDVLPDGSSERAS